MWIGTEVYPLFQFMYSENGESEVRNDRPKVFKVRDSYPKFIFKVFPHIFGDFLGSALIYLVKFF